MLLLQFSQDMKKTASSSGMTSRRGPETKRLTSFKNLNEVKKKPLAVDNHYADLKKTEAHLLGPPKKLFIMNLTEMPKQGNAGMREFQRGTTKTTGPSKSGYMQMNTNKVITCIIQQYLI
ncbi:hypothetical protein BHM03_00013854 [Ensete ventricosum]|nr:hypothetical protein BHM03_00013854 [Ensete ventricosum]